VVEGAEQCDDGFTDDCGTCNADCTAAGICSTCGDGELCPEFEKCDDGGESVTCDADCTFAECGDGTRNVTAGEECEPPGCDCCDASCHFEPSGTACGDPSDTACDNPDTCDAGGACQSNYESLGTSCGDEDSCNGVELCDGDGSCVGTREADCNENEIEDVCDIAAGTSEDCDANGIPDECENDSDGDGFIDACDNCVDLDNQDQANFDGDELGDVCDPDIDNDGVPNARDVCPFSRVGARVDAEGRPHGDINLDCDVDLDDLRLLANFNAVSK